MLRDYLTKVIPTTKMSDMVLNVLAMGAAKFQM